MPQKEINKRTEVKRQKDGHTNTKFSSSALITRLTSLREIPSRSAIISIAFWPFKYFAILKKYKRVGISKVFFRLLNQKAHNAFPKVLKQLGKEDSFEIPTYRSNSATTSGGCSFVSCSIQRLSRGVGRMGSASIESW